MPLWGTDERIDIAVEIIIKAMRDIPISKSRINLVVALQVLRCDIAEVIANEREIENALGRKL